MTVNKAGQHGLAAQVDDLVDLAVIEVAKFRGFQLGPHKDDLAVQRGDDFSLFRVLDVLGLFHRFRNGVNLTVMVDRIRKFLCGIQLHASTKNQSHGRSKAEHMPLHVALSVLHLRSSS